MHGVVEYCIMMKDVIYTRTIRSGRPDHAASVSYRRRTKINYCKNCNTLIYVRNTLRYMDKIFYSTNFITYVPLMHLLYIQIFECLNKKGWGGIWTPNTYSAYYSADL
jgi:hypothetical protein